ncbi:hypothetical protein OHC33_007759 [Knufia fluminis]|uniref:Uncharacterized protein n=1 Tax=Knufia fluminis TaxID=191047 RepID=A0AAN8F4V1_9EURO|nr:hypothetical protein OHC33_007759 [Knufia fluminis]
MAQRLLVLTMNSPGKILALLKSKRRERKCSSCSMGLADDEPRGHKIAVSGAVSLVADRTVAESTSKAVALQSFHPVRQLGNMNQIGQSAGISQDSLLGPAEIKAIFNSLPTHTLKADEDVRSPTIELVVYDTTGRIIDIVLAALDTCSERCAISESRARKQGWRPREEEEAGSALIPLCTFRGEPITSLGTHWVSAEIVGLDQPVWFEDRFQVVPDDQLAVNVEAVTLDIALILREGLLDGLCRNACRFGMDA